MQAKTLLAVGVPIITLSFGAVKGLDWLDARNDQKYPSKIEFNTTMSSNISKTQISLLDIQIMIVEGHIRDVDRISEMRELTSQEKRDLRLDEVRLSALRKERRGILGSPE